MLIHETAGTQLAAPSSPGRYQVRAITSGQGSSGYYPAGTIRDAVDRGEVAIVGCQYRLMEGRAVPYIAVGQLDIEVADVS